MTIVTGTGEDKWMHNNNCDVMSVEDDVLGSA